MESVAGHSYLTRFYFPHALYCSQSYFIHCTDITLKVGDHKNVLFETILSLNTSGVFIPI